MYLFFAHIAFVQARTEQGRPFKYLSQRYGFPVVTNQEKELLINVLERVCAIEDNSWSVDYGREPQADYRIAVDGRRVVEMQDLQATESETAGDE